ncbi:PQQ-binding-like beta-propeller repeat protein [uncultured Agrococcus sp.]|uniref:outer membrane protein assembly factor BamB family protein n=1 Tax=uncultured Agrococcus sp. TaxID=382258 RepID=UPI0025D0B474|nr:PQQ-binding-like beta-propeller repeat protein [uncultured Agrococcus sp.]
MRRAIAGAALCLMLVGCTSDDVSTAEPVSVASPLSQTDTSALLLPTPYEDREFVTPGWSLEPLHADGVYLAATPGEAALEFTAVDEFGEVLWTAERPLSCSGFTLTVDAEGRSLAILTDLTSSSTAVAQTTASAYDLHTGERVWGPVDVPGPYRGPGAVFAYAPKSVMGESGPRLALDPTTGETAYDEETGRATVVGEYSGTLLVAEDRELIATDANGEELWRSEGAERWVPSVPGTYEHARLDGRYALVATASGGASLIELATGEIKGEGLRDAAFDIASGTLVMHGGSGLTAVDADGNELWQMTVGEDVEIAGLGDVFLYLLEGGSLRVHNVITGAHAQAYPEGDGRIVYPVAVTDSGAALLLDGGAYLLATAPRGIGSP